LNHSYHDDDDDRADEDDGTEDSELMQGEASVVLAIMSNNDLLCSKYKQNKETDK